MFCNKCGRIIESDSKFCGGCGAPVPIPNNIKQNVNMAQNIEKTSIQQNNSENQNNDGQAQVNTNYNQTYQNYDNIVNPSMKKYAILSIVIPLVALFLYFFCDLTVWLAICLSAIGFSFAHKGKLYSEKLAKIGYVLNTILLVVAVLIWIILLLIFFTQW